MGKFLGKAELLTKEELLIEKVVFDNGDYTFVRQMNGKERDTFEQSLVRKVRDKKGNITAFEQNTEDYRAKLCVCCMCDEAGKLLLGPLDYGQLGLSMSAKRLEEIATVAQRLNRLSEESKEEVIKNFVADQVGNSTLDSVEN